MHNIDEVLKPIAKFFNTVSDLSVAVRKLTEENQELCRTNTLLRQVINKHLKGKGVLLEEYGFSLRVENTLFNAGLTTLGEVADLTENEVRSLRGAGSKTIAELYNTLQKHELKFSTTAAKSRRNRELRS